MKQSEYSVDQIKLLETQLMIKNKLKSGDLICVSDDDFSSIQPILMKNNIGYTSIRDSEAKISTLLIV